MQEREQFICSQI